MKHCDIHLICSYTVSSYSRIGSYCDNHMLCVALLSFAEHNLIWLCPFLASTQLCNVWGTALNIVFVKSVRT